MEHQIGDLVKFTIDGLHTSPHDRLGLVVGCSKSISCISNSFVFLQVLYDGEIYLINPHWASTIMNEKEKE